MSASEQYPVAQLTTTSTASIASGAKFPWNQSPILNDNFYSFASNRLTFDVKGVYRLRATIGDAVQTVSDSGSGQDTVSHPDSASLPVDETVTINYSFSDTVPKTEWRFESSDGVLPGRGDASGGSLEVLYEADAGDWVETHVLGTTVADPNVSVFIAERLRR